MENWVEFEAGSTKFSLHAIPSEIARQIEISSPPKPRETDPIKLSFEVDNVQFGVDPEGNVFGIYAAD